MNFTFKIGQKIKEAWPLYKENYGVLLLMTIATFAVNFTGQRREEGDPLTSTIVLITIVSAIIGLYLSYMWIRLILNIIDKKEFNFFSKQSIPSFGKIWNFIKTSILYGLCVMGGFILLIIPGFYVAGRLVFATYISVEKNQGARASIKEAWDMTKDNGWLLFWKSFVVALFMAVGFLALLVGSFITYPIGFMLMLMMYREFVKFKSQGISTQAAAPASVPVQEIKETSTVQPTDNPQ